MKKLVILLSALFLSATAYTQDITVESFTHLKADHTANTPATTVMDSKGEKCALIKIPTSEVGFKFDTDKQGVVKVTEHDGEIWLYLPSGCTHISISHEGMQPLNNYDLGQQLSGACTYLMILKTNKDAALQAVTFKVAPANAAVTLESADPALSFEKRTLAFVNGETTLKIPFGKYKYTAVLSGYYVEESTIDISTSTRKLNIELTPMAEAKEAAVAAAVLLPKQTFTVGEVSFEMIEVEGGTFMMGANEGDSEAYEDEKPLHSVTLSSFYVGETEVTQKLWKAVMGKNHSYWKGENRPVNNISWDDCQQFISKLNSLTGANFRLLTEAEWEYAARGGNKSKGYKYSGSDNVKDVAWCGSFDGKNYPVKSKAPNELGIYDMSGNVYEWCADEYGQYQSGSKDQTTRVYRGGCYSVPASYCRVSSRFCADPSEKLFYLGLRLAL